MLMLFVRFVTEFHTLIGNIDIQGDSEGGTPKEGVGYRPGLR